MVLVLLIKYLKINMGILIIGALILTLFVLKCIYEPALDYVVSYDSKQLLLWYNKVTDKGNTIRVYKVLFKIK